MGATGVCVGGGAGRGGLRGGGEKVHLGQPAGGVGGFPTVMSDVGFVALLALRGSRGREICKVRPGCVLVGGEAGRGGLRGGGHKVHLGQPAGGVCEGGAAQRRP